MRAVTGLGQARKSQAAFARGTGAERLCGAVSPVEQAEEQGCCMICNEPGNADSPLAHVGFVQPLAPYHQTAHDASAKRQMCAVQFCGHFVHHSCHLNWVANLRDQLTSQHSVDPAKVCC